MSIEISKAFFIINIAVIGLTAVVLGSITTKECDDGKTNLEVDWYGYFSDYICSGPEIKPNYQLRPFSYCEDIPPGYSPRQYCMQDTIPYKYIVDVVGSYRPIPPAFGEYLYCPKQRYLHAMEGGAIVMLYHPCADPSQIDQLKSLVKGCLRRYIITPNGLLDPKYPLVLLSWGCYLSMSHVDPEAAQWFIVNHALKGPEEIVNDGNYSLGLIEKSKIVTNSYDVSLCPNFNRNHVY